MTIFSKIIKGDIPSFKIAENEKFYAFLDINPLVEGHTLVIPKLEIDNFWDMQDNYLAEILLFAKPIATAIEKSFPCNRCGLSVVGLDVPHAHMHLIPLNNMNDINFTRKKLSPTNEELKSTQEKILEAMKKSSQ